MEILNDDKKQKKNHKNKKKKMKKFIKFFGSKNKEPQKDDLTEESMMQNQPCQSDEPEFSRENNTQEKMGESDSQIRTSYHQIQKEFVECISL